MNAYPHYEALSRRRLLHHGGLAALLGALLPLNHAAAKENQRTLLAGASSREAQTTDNDVKKPYPLQFRKDGSFKIVQFNDTQDDHLTDRRTIEFMGKVLDREHPDFAVINGDVITKGPSTAHQVYQALNNVVLPMEWREIPWAVTFGNHDEDSVQDAGTGVYEQQMAEFVRRYRFNLNPPAGELPYGHSDAQLLIGASDNSTARFAIWLIDSGNYLTKKVDSSEEDEIPDYDYIRPGQIDWYLRTSRNTEKRYGHAVPGLMFFHIPTYEHLDMWFGGPGKNTASQHSKAVTTHGIQGAKNEDVYYGAFNSGIYAAARERGDVLGIYCGHDHINSYSGHYGGIELGYCPGTGFGPYGLKDGTWQMHTLRGARVFELDEKSERIYQSTRLIFAKDLGIDMNPVKQALKQPEAIPHYVRADE